MIDYKNFYGLSENPFDIVSDPRFFFASESHREALASLQYGINYRKGFILLLGEAGVGKTMLLQHLISTLDKQVKIIFFPEPQLPFPKMLREMLSQLNLKPEFETKGSMMHRLYYHLIESLGQNENVVLIIDSAENIPLDLLEEVRLLANLETGASKLLQIVLAGQPQLGKKLHSDIVRQIEQRIVIHCSVNPLSAEESRQYIDYRLKTVQSSASAIFADQAIDLLSKSARGIPLTINILCDNALSLGYCLSEKIISAATVKKVRHEKSVLTGGEAKALASRMRGRLIRKIFILLPVLILLALVLFFGGPYVQSFLNSVKTNQTVTAPGLNEKRAMPQVRLAIVGDHGQISPGPTAKDSVAKPPRIPESRLPDENSAHSPFRVKKIVQVKAGDNLSVLTWQNYNLVNETLMDHILKLNPEITNPHRLLPNQKIRIPEITESLLIVRYSENLYKVHLRTYADAKSARDFCRTASSWTKETEMIPWKISATETWLRVMTGSFTSRQQALEAVGGMQEKGFPVIPSNEGRIN